MGDFCFRLIRQGLDVDIEQVAHQLKALGVADLEKARSWDTPKEDRDGKSLPSGDDIILSNLTRVVGHLS